MDLDFYLHEAQAEIFNTSARYKIVAAGRRFGKSHFAAITMLIAALQTEKQGAEGNVYDLGLKEVYYVAPTFEQGKKIMWNLLKDLGRYGQPESIIDSVHENTATLKLKAEFGGRRISIKGADRPDTLRGIGLSYVVLDEYAYMKPFVWEEIIRPALTDVEGEALFIGTPDGKNHFYDLYLDAAKDTSDEWRVFQFKSIDNPFLSRREISRAKDQLASSIFRQEYEASFTEGGGDIFREDWWQFDSVEPRGGDYYIACDLAGFTKVSGATNKPLIVRDEHAIAVVKVHPGGWWVKEIIHGYWDVQETALRIVHAYRKYRPLKLGIEKGISKNAVLPYLWDEQKRLGVFFRVEDLSHGNQHKANRIRWAIEGRLEKGRLVLSEPDEWTKALIEQANDFPSPLAHNDMLDALSYIDQLANVVYYDTADDEIWEPLDLEAGY